MEEKKISNRVLLAIGICLIISLVAGTFFDYPISQKLYHAGNPFGLFFAGYGPLPSFLAFIVVSYILWTNVPETKNYRFWMQRIVSVLLVPIDIFVIAKFAHNNLSFMPFPVSILIAALIVAGTFALLYRLLKDADPDQMNRLAIALILLAVIEAILINTIKIPWQRPRMRFISTDLAKQAGVVFQPWYRLGNALRETLVSQGVGPDEFKSFPSGHTGSAACALGLYFLAGVSPKLKDKKNWFFWIGLLWALLTALSRITIGAHFLTDVTVGFTMTFLVFLFSKKIMDM